RRDGEVAGPAGRVEDTVPGPNDGVHGGSAPALVEPGGHDPIHHVVHGRDPIEHALDAFGRQRAGPSGHVPRPVRTAVMAVYTAITHSPQRLIRAFSIRS